MPEPVRKRCRALWHIARIETGLESQGLRTEHLHLKLEQIVHKTSRMDTQLQDLIDIVTGLESQGLRTEHLTEHLHLKLEQIVHKTSRMDTQLQDLIGIVNEARKHSLGIETKIQYEILDRIKLLKRGGEQLTEAVSHIAAQSGIILPSLNNSRPFEPSYSVEIGPNPDELRERVDRSYKHLYNPFRYYEAFIDELLQIKDVELRPLYEVATLAANGKKIIGLRHDIDEDPVTGLRAARYLAQRAVCGSFYLLHTSHYYGKFCHGVFIRNPKLPQWVKGFVVSGCEVGIHNDALGVFLTRDADGVVALKTEIAWLRSQGAAIKGSVAHNSPPLYGAGNEEIFRGRVYWGRQVSTPNGLILPLGTVSESELGLTYEGTFSTRKREFDVRKAEEFVESFEPDAVRSGTWMRQLLLDNPCCDYSVDYQFWLVGKDSWVAAGRFGENELFEWKVSASRVIEIVGSLPPNTKSLMVIHPCYVSGGG